MSRIFSIAKSILTLGCFLFPAFPQAHEFWIQPHKYQLDTSENLVADIRVGMDFSGNALAYIPSNTNEFNITGSAGTRPVEGRLGDSPAVNITSEGEGLQIINLFSTSSMLTWDDYEKFEEFARLHGLDWILASHEMRGLPNTGFKEAYTRFVKSLVSVGDGGGQDRYLGMFFELVAGANPYTDDISAGMPISVLYKGVPLPNMQVDVFYRDVDDALTRLSVETNARGTALIPNLGAGEYMVNSVHMMIPFEADIERTGVVWHSLWGSITYQIDA